MTEKIYESQGLIMDFDAKVLSVEPFGDKFAVELDRTAFFPGGGGQEADEGFLDNEPVVSIRQSEGRILHIVASPVFSAGSICTGHIDRSLRLRRMEHHTGEHILSGIIHKTLGYENVGFHLGSEVVTIDTSGPLSEDNIIMCESLANRAIRENLPVEISFYEKVPENINYRSKKELSGIIRLVKIGDVDTCACCAPHLSSTGQVGAITIINHMPYKGGTRLFMLAGDAATLEIRRQLNALRSASQMLSVKPLETPSAVLKLRQTLENERFANSALISDYCNELLSSQQNRSDFRLLVFDKLNSKIAVVLGEKWMQGVLFFAAFFGEPGSRKFIIKSGSLNLQEKIGLINEILHARGGGRSGEVSGCTTLTDNELSAACEQLYAKLSV